jgi:hypothetical protein
MLLDVPYRLLDSMRGVAESAGEGPLAQQVRPCESST